MSTAEREPEPAPPLLELLALEEVDRDIFRHHQPHFWPFALYGGQVAAQALVAAGRTVPEGRVPHSMHGYFLRAGSADVPLVFRVERDHDGGSFSSRRTIATQDGKVIFNLSASFVGVDRAPADPPGAGAGQMRVPDPAALPLFDIDYLSSFELRTIVVTSHDLLPTRLLARVTTPLPDDPLLHACALTYLTDASSGLGAFSSARSIPGSSLDHAIWFHRPARLDEWVVLDLVPHTTAGGRGWYTGTVHDSSGRRVATLTQEALMRWAASLP
jgi:acyl-CoA thioesterase-2